MTRERHTPLFHWVGGSLFASPLFSPADMYEFKRDVASDKKLEAERILRYLEERLKLKDTHITKLKLKSRSALGIIFLWSFRWRGERDPGVLVGGGWGLPPTVVGRGGVRPVSGSQWRQF